MITKATVSFETSLHNISLLTTLYDLLENTKITDSAHDDLAPASLDMYFCLLDTILDTMPGVVEEMIVGYGNLENEADIKPPILLSVYKLAMERRGYQMRTAEQAYPLRDVINDKK